jgi:hypothetical protein
LFRNGPEELEQIGTTVGGVLLPGVVVCISRLLPNALAEAAADHRAIPGFAQVQVSPQHRDVSKGVCETAQSTRAGCAGRQIAVADKRVAVQCDGAVTGDSEAVVPVATCLPILHHRSHALYDRARNQGLSRTRDRVSTDEIEVKVAGQLARRLLVEPRSQRAREQSLGYDAPIFEPDAIAYDHAALGMASGNLQLNFELLG